MDLKSFSHSSADWRKTISLNTRRSYFVIASFILIYMLLGFILDLYFNSMGSGNKAGLTEIAYQLLTFHLYPIATLVLGVIAGVAIWITFIFNNKLMLLGTEYYEITPLSARSLQERQMYNVVEEMKIAAGLSFMPKVYIIDADYMNAFASGYSEKSAMVAITRGLLSKLNRAELQAVMAHELSHIRHLDIKLTLMASVLANLTLIVIDFLFRFTLYTRVGDERQNGNGNGNRGRNNLFIIIFLLRIILPIVTAILILFLSRTREYMADAGCVELMRDNQPLASALLKITNDHNENIEKYSAEYQQTPHETIRREAYIFDPTQAGITTTAFHSFSDLFSTHPNISKRLAALGFKKKM
jgi:heat shock protein HtpX